MNNKEIEVKYKVSSLPSSSFNSNLVKKLYIEQFYFSKTTERENLLKEIFKDISFDTISTFRIRLIKENDKTYYIITLKTKGLYERNEYEEEVDFNTFAKFTINNIESKIVKNRYVYLFDDLNFEFDEYLNLRERLFTCEVEFDSSEEMSAKIEDVEEVLNNKLKLEIKDVSLDNKYKNSNLIKYFG